MSNPSDAGRTLNALRRREKKICAQCGREFDGLKKAVYCNRECTNAAYYAAHADYLRADRRRRYRGKKEGGQEAAPGA